MMMNEDVLSVSQLNTFIKDVIQAGFPQPIWVCGEIQGYDRQKGKNHIFFQLVEKDQDSQQQKATIDLVIWAGKKGLIEAACKSAEDAFELRDDIEVKFLCQVDFYPPHGRVRLSVENVDPFFTLGKMAQEKQRLIARLKEEGVLDRNKQRELTPVPLHIGLVTSDDSAAYNDFISELRKSGYAFKVYLRNSLMQGKKAEKDVSQALDELSHIKGLEAIVITRGGGSLSDLSCFDSEMIAKRIASLELPVLCGIGHEINTTVTDLAAHTHAKTPTAIAQFLVTRVRDFLNEADEMLKSIIDRAQDILADEKVRLKSGAIELQTQTNQYLKEHNIHLVRLWESIKVRPVDMIKQEKTNIGQFKETLLKSFKVRLGNEAQRMKHLKTVIDMAHPANTLKRGFSITRGKDGKVLKNASMAENGEAITTELANGIIESEIRKINKEHAYGRSQIQ